MRWGHETMIMWSILNVRVFVTDLPIRDWKFSNHNNRLLVQVTLLSYAFQPPKELLHFQLSSIEFILVKQRIASHTVFAWSIIHSIPAFYNEHWSLSQFFSHKKFTISQIRRHSYNARKKYPKKRSAAAFLCARFDSRAFRNRALVFVHILFFSFARIFSGSFSITNKKNGFILLYTQCVNGIMPPIIMASSRERGIGLHCFLCDRTHFVAFKILIMHYHRVLPTLFESIDDSLHLLVLSSSMRMCE